MFSGIIKKSQILPSEALSFGQMLPEGCYPDLDWCEFFRWGACGGEGKCALVTISSASSINPSYSSNNHITTQTTFQAIQEISMIIVWSLLGKPSL